MSETGRFSIAAMVAFTRDALLACGVPAGDAELAAKQMIEADVTGFDAHGIVAARQLLQLDQVRPGQSEGQHQGVAALAGHSAGRWRRRHRPSGDDAMR